MAPEVASSSSAAAGPPLRRQRRNCSCLSQTRTPDRRFERDTVSPARDRLGRARPSPKALGFEDPSGLKTQEPGPASGTRERALGLVDWTLMACRGPDVAFLKAKAIPQIQATVSQ